MGKTLREQGIDESETVLLRRRFFFSDQNIDSRDPVQLNLLYVQARDTILDGTHPVTQEKGKDLNSNLYSIFSIYIGYSVSKLDLELYFLDVIKTDFVFQFF